MKSVLRKAKQSPYAVCDINDIVKYDDRSQKKRFDDASTARGVNIISSGCCSNLSSSDRR